MDTLFGRLVSLCSPELAQKGLAAGLLIGLFLAGLAGSVVHCAPMCGGFVLGQVSDRMARLPAAQLCEWRRLRAGLILPYHLGRLTTYALLGALAASSVALLGRAPWLTWLSAALMVAAAMVFLLQGLAWMGVVARRAPAVPPTWTRLIARLSRRIDRDGAAGTYLLGLTLGLLPCGFLYGALFAAASGGGWMRGAAAMLCFGLGTVPILMAIGIAGQSAARTLQAHRATVTAMLMLWNAVMLLGAAGLQIYA